MTICQSLYSPRELLARIKSIFKRESLTRVELEVSERFVVDEESTQIYLDNKVLKLTLAEYEILKLLKFDD